MSEDSSRDFRREAGILLLVLVLLEGWLRAPVLFGSLALFQRDLMLVYFPLVQSALREVSQGAWPLRDPTSAFGQPLLADPSCQILYPPVWLHVLLPPSLAYAWFVSLHSVFGALGVALLARRISGGGLVAGLVAGCAWLLSGPLQSLASLWHHMAGAAWMPWVWLGVEGVLSSDPGGARRWLGIALGAQMIAGSADMCAMTLLMAAVRILLSRGWTQWRVWAGGLVTAVALSAGMWLPAAELLVNSGRASIPETARTYWSLNPLSLAEFFLPIPISALPLLPAWRGAFFEGREPFLGSMFFGVSILPLCLAAFADARLSRAVRASGFLFSVAAVLAAFGKYAVFYSWVVAVLPPLKILRYPSKAMIPAAVLLCVFAGVGAVSLRRSARSRGVACFGMIVLALCALSLLGPLMEPFISTFLDRSNAPGMTALHDNLPRDLVITVALLAILAGYMWTPSRRMSAVMLCVLGLGHLQQSQGLNKDLNATVPASVLSYRPKYLELMSPPKGGRLYVYDYWGFIGRADRFLRKDDVLWPEVASLDPSAANLVTARTYLSPLTGAFWKVEYAWDSDLRMLFNHRLAELTLGIRRVEGGPGFLRLLQISGVQRVVAMHEAGMGDLQLLAQKDFHPQPLRIFAVPGALPRAFLVSGRVRGSGRDLLDLLDPAFDPRTQVLVDREPARPVDPNFAGTASILEQRSDRILIRTTATAPAFLALIEGSMPGWRAWIDGRPAAVESANAIFIGAEVPKGDHQVEFRFLPTSAVVGVLLTVLTALFLIARTLRRLKTSAETAEIAAPEANIGAT